MCKGNQKSLIADVQKILRKNIFISWFNLVHQELPALHKAAQFHLRSKFQALRGLAIRNRSQRAKKNLLKQLSHEYYPYMLKKRGVCKWRTVAARTSFIQERLAKFKQAKLQKQFDGWWHVLDRLSQGKSRSIMQRELNKRFLLRRGLTALLSYCDEAHHAR